MIGFLFLQETSPIYVGFAFAGKEVLASVDNKQREPEFDIGLACKHQIEMAKIKQGGHEINPKLICGTWKQSKNDCDMQGQGNGTVLILETSTWGICQFCARIDVDLSFDAPTWFSVLLLLGCRTVKYT